jgi:hypothetical protein
MADEKIVNKLVSELGSGSFSLMSSLALRELICFMIDNNCESYEDLKRAVFIKKGISIS